MHPVEQDSGYHIFVVPGLGSGIVGLFLLIFGQNLVKLFVPFAAGDPLLKAGTQFVQHRTEQSVFAFLRLGTPGIRPQMFFSFRRGLPAITPTN